MCREEAPISSRLNAIDLYLVVCVFLVFGKKGGCCPLHTDSTGCRSLAGVRSDTDAAQGEEDAADVFVQHTAEY